jgi:pimeloyl-ACP methyl ester carboxylesterase
VDLQGLLGKFKLLGYGQSLAYTKVRYDVRGHGRSGKPSDVAAWESKRLAEDFDAVVEAFKLDKPFVLGW